VREDASPDQQTEAPVVDVRVEGPPVERGEEVLTPAALEFVADLQTRFGAHRDAILAARATRRAEIAAARSIDVREETADVLGDRPNQLDRRRDDVAGTPEELLDVAGVPGDRTMAGLRANVEVALRYLAAWLAGNGAVGIHGLMEDAATAEISRSQVWQWVHAGVELDTGETVTDELVRGVIEEEIAGIGELDRLDDARRLFEQVALADEFPDFLTLPAYDLID
jgi:malate synthase